MRELALNCDGAAPVEGSGTTPELLLAAAAAAATTPVLEAPPLPLLAGLQFNRFNIVAVFFA